MKKRMGLQGDAYSKHLQLMKLLGMNNNMDLLLATVTDNPPNLKIKVDNETEEFDKNDLIVSEHLTNHTRVANISSNSLSIGMSIQGYVPHVHQTHDINIIDAAVNFTDELKIGDRVQVIFVEATMKHHILDRVVTYK